MMVIRINSSPCYVLQEVHFKNCYQAGRDLKMSAGLDVINAPGTTYGSLLDGCPARVYTALGEHALRQG